MLNTDILIIGGGASGLSAAIEIMRTYPFAKVIIAERLDRTGKKILSTGNGRCNLGNKNISSEFYHGSVKNISEIFENTPSSEDFFNSLGLLCVNDEEGRIYPYSKSAASVLTALRLYLSDYGVKEECGFMAEKIEKTNNGYAVYSESGKIIYCRRIIAACGGYAAPSLGTDGSALRMFRNMGLEISKICPAVAPFRVNPEQLKGLKGIRAKGKVFAVTGDKILRSERGEIQFTDNSISGICVFNLAYLFAEYEGKLKLRIDLMPEISYDELFNILTEIKKNRSDFPVEEFLSGIFVKNLSLYIMRKSGVLNNFKNISSIKKSDIKNIISIIKSMEFNVTGCSSWQNAQVTAGGISGKCVGKDLQSIKYPGIYFSGEILDVHGECGGFNLEWAWASGIWTGRNCSNSIYK